MNNYQIVNGYKVLIEYCDWTGMWRAIDDDNTDEYGTWQHDTPVGEGDTEEEAIQDLLEKLNENLY